MRLLYGGAAAGVTALLGGLMYFSKSNHLNIKTDVNENETEMEKIVGKQTANILLQDSVWYDLVDRLSEFRIFAKEEYAEVLRKTANLIEFDRAVDLKQIKLSYSTPRKYKSRLHDVIESVRCMRAQLEITFPSGLDDFDEIASELQTTHNDYWSNMHLKSISAVEK